MPDSTPGHSGRLVPCPFCWQLCVAAIEAETLRANIGNLLMAVAAKREDFRWADLVQET